MPSPIHQKYSSQTHHFTPSVFKSSSDRRESTASTNSAASEGPSSPTTDRRRSSVSGAFASLQALKRPENNPENATRRASLTDARVGHQGFFGSMWTNFTRGPTNIVPKAPKEERDISTLRNE